MRRFVRDARGEIAALPDEVFAILIDRRDDRHIRVEDIRCALRNRIKRVAVVPTHKGRSCAEPQRAPRRDGQFNLLCRLCLVRRHNAMNPTYRLVDRIDNRIGPEPLNRCLLEQLWRGVPQREHDTQIRPAHPQSPHKMACGDRGFSLK